MAAAAAAQGRRQFPLDTVRLSCDVTDQATGRPVADASVTYQAGTTEFATKTNAAGRCELDMPASEVAGVAFPAASVEKLGYEPQTILCPKLQGGDSCVNSVKIVALADNVSLPVGGGIVMHLGDDLFEGAINSQFQKKTDGAELWSSSSTTGLPRSRPATPGPRSTWTPRVWQTGFCRNLIALVGDVGTITLPGGNSPSDGYWGGGKQVPFEFAVDRVGAQRAEVRVSAGACSGTTDLDDFEIDRMRVYFD